MSLNNKAGITEPESDSRTAGCWLMWGAARAAPTYLLLTDLALWHPSMVSQQPNFAGVQLQNLMHLIQDMKMANRACSSILFMH